MFKQIQIFLIVLFLIPLVFSSGYHPASEILTGNFSGNFNFMDGNIGIGTTDSNFALNIEKTQDSDGRLFQLENLGSASSILDIKTAGSESFVRYRNNADYWSVGIDSSNNFAIGDSFGNIIGNDKFVISQAGNVGIGTASPEEVVHIANADPSLKIQDSTAGSIDYGQVFSKLSFAARDDAYLTEGLNAEIRSVHLRTGTGHLAADAGLQFLTTSPSSYTLTPKMTIDNDGNVGIGTTSPGVKLSIVDGSIRLRSNGLASGALGFEDGTPMIIQFDSVNDWDTRLSYKANDGELIIDNGAGLTAGGGNAGQYAGIIFNAGPNSASDTASLSTGRIALVREDSISTKGSMVFDIRDAGEVMRIDSSGNVGIGVINPNSRLNVKALDETSDALRTIRSATDTQYISFKHSSAGNDISSHSAVAYADVMRFFSTTDTSNTAPTGGELGFTFNILGSEVMRIGGNGNVGIGTTSSAARIYGYVNGAWNSANYAFVFENDETQNSYGNTVRIIGGGGAGAGDSASNILMVGDNDGNPDFVIKGDGAITYLGTLTDASDRRLKENFENITNPINKIKNITGLTFNMKNQTSRQAGVIAQDVQKVLPEAVSIIDNQSHLGVDYTQLVPLLIEGIKEQQNKIEELEERIEQLENK